MLWSSLVVVLLLGTGDLDAAERALAAGKAEEALALLGDLADGNDAPGRALKVLGRAHLALTQYESAVDPLLRASDSFPKDTGLARDAATACYLAAVSGGGMSARAYLEDARRLAERAASPLLKGKILLALRDYEGALPHFRKASESSADRLEALAGRADCLRELGREGDAKKAFRDVLEEALEQENLPTAYTSAFNAGAGGRLLQWLDDRITKRPGDQRLRRYRGFARLNLLLYIEAAKDLRSVVEAAPHDIAAKTALASALYRAFVESQREEFFAEAVALSRDVLEREPGHRGSRNNLVWSARQHFDADNLEASAELLRFLHASDPEDIEVSLNLAAILRRLHAYDEATKALRGALEVYPDDPDVLNDLGILVDGRGDRAEAVALWTRVLEEESDNLNALENLYTAAWERGDRKTVDEMIRRGSAAAFAKERSQTRWRWFRDRRLWAPEAFRRRK